MKLENQVVSLELAKKLKELGVKQESCFVYAKREGDGWKNTEFDKSPIPVEWNDERIHESIPTYTVAELYSLLYSYGICDILLDIEPEKLADHLAEKLCQTLKKK